MTKDLLAKEKPVLPKLVGSLTALAAMGSAIIVQVDPLTTVVRGALAFGIGMVAGTAWIMVTSFRVPELTLLESEALTESSTEDGAAEAA